MGLNLDELRKEIEDIAFSIFCVVVGLGICTVMFLPVWMIVLLCGD